MFKYPSLQNIYNYNCIFLKKYSVNAVNICDNYSNSHVPVLISKVMNSIEIKKGGIYLDMTFGAGGHSKKILEYDSSVTLYSLDRDLSTIEYSDQLKQQFLNRFYPMIGKFSDLPELLRQRGVTTNYFSGIIMDLGVSSMQFNSPNRGFMLSKDGPLDMRMDGDRDLQQPTAADVIKHTDEESLRKILKTYGGEKRARMISNAIVQARLFKQLNTTRQLAELIESIVGINSSNDKLGRFAHPATLTFQALRIFVNDELNQLDLGIRLAHYYLKIGGILSIISFHSLEDAIVKKHFLGSDMVETPEAIGKPSWKNLKSPLATFSQDELNTKIPKPWILKYKRVITPTEEEVTQNPRARSAKLRVAAKSCFSYT